MRILVLSVILAFSTGVTAQAPEPTGSDLRRQMAEITADVAIARAEVKALIVEKVKADNLKLKQKLAAQARLTRLVAEHGKVEVKVRDLQATMIDDSDKVDTALLMKRHNELEALIAKANRTFACRVLSIGCVGK